DPSGNFVFARDIKGASGSDYIGGNSITVDATGNAYITGYFSGTFDFDPGAGVDNLTSVPGQEEMFILKLDVSGNFVWTKQIVETSTASINGNSITLDAMGNIYTTGVFHGYVDFDPGPATFFLTSTFLPHTDMFVLKLDVSGNFIWAKNIENNGDAKSIAVDPLGSVYTTGYFHGTVDFDHGAGYATIISSANDVFILKLDASGNYVWVKNMDGTGSSQASSLVLDGVSNVYTTGCFDGTVDFDPGTGVHNISSLSSINDAFVSKLDASGNFVWAVSMGGAAATDNSGYSIALDASSDIYTFGSFKGTTDFDPGSGTADLTSVGSSNDIFIQKLNQANVATSITENAAENNISIYPNPTNGLFSIALASSEKNISMEIYNNIGELVYSKQNTDTQTLIDLKNNAAGFYFIKVMSENKIVGIKKIIRE
ncbi:MAG: SBBP repeat-containing protein, partial [Bacteroidia bacterium]